MKARISITVAVLAVAFLAMGATHPVHSDEDSIARLKDRVNSLEQRVQALESKLQSIAAKPKRLAQKRVQRGPVLYHPCRAKTEPIDPAHALMLALPARLL